MKLRWFTITTTWIPATDDNCNSWFVNHSLVFCPQMEMNNQLEMLTAREQLMEDIDCIINNYFEYFDVNHDEELVKILCDAVCRNFPLTDTNSP